GRSRRCRRRGRRRSWSWRRLRRGCGDRTCGGWFFASQFGYGQLHRAINGQPSDGFVFVDPTVSAERLGLFFAEIFKFFFAGLSAFLLVVVAARRRSDDCEHDHTEEGKKKRDTKPRREW